MKTYVCDVCKTNRSDEGTVYHLTVEKISPDGNKFTFKPMDITQFNIKRPPQSWCYTEVDV